MHCIVSFSREPQNALKVLLLTQPTASPSTFSQTISPNPAIDIDNKSLVHPEIFVSTLGSCLEPGINVVKDHGYITSTVLKCKHGGGGGMQAWLAQEMAEAEKGRALAIAKLRTKAAAAGANAILGLKVGSSRCFATLPTYTGHPS